MDGILLKKLTKAGVDLPARVRQMSRIATLWRIVTLLSRRTTMEPMVTMGRWLRRTSQQFQNDVKNKK